MITDNRLPALAVVLDQDRLSEAFGASLRADSLRYKPGVSVVARVHGSEQTGWVAGYAPGHTAKLHKLRHRAAADGAVLRSVTLASATAAGGELIMGPISLDYKLRKPLRSLSTDRTPADVANAVLNYNPNRRLVLALHHRLAPVVAKVTAGRAPVPSALLDTLAAGGVPVLPQVHPVGLPESRHISYYPWHGSGNLRENLANGTAGVESIRQTGAALAALHAVPLPAGGAIAIRHTAAAEAELKVTAVVKDLAGLLPRFAERVHAVADRTVSALPEVDRHVLLHGDFSSDQVLGGPDNLRIIDLDRWGRGPAAADLGSFVAADMADPSGMPQDQLLGALLDGYGPVDEASLTAWTAFHLYCRLAEPFRSCSPSWPEQIVQRLEQIDGLPR